MSRSHADVLVESISFDILVTWNFNVNVHFCVIEDFWHEYFEGCCMPFCSSGSLGKVKFVLLFVSAEEPYDCRKSKNKFNPYITNFGWLNYVQKLEKPFITMFFLGYVCFKKHCPLLFAVALVNMGFWNRAVFVVLSIFISNNIYPMRLAGQIWWINDVSILEP
jgi:hypothetical protein